MTARQRGARVLPSLTALSHRQQHVGTGARPAPDALDAPDLVVVGVLAYVVAPGTPRRLFVQEVVVKKDMRRGGVGTELLRALLAEHGSAGGTVDLVVEETKEDALGFYERFGFEPSQEERLVEPRPTERYLRVDAAMLAERVASATSSRALQIEAFRNRQHLALEGLRWHGAVLGLVREAHGTFATLPHDRSAQCRVRYLVALMPAASDAE